jgi:nicotinamidase-related amidase
LIIDMQEGLYSLVRDFDPTVFRDSLIAHASLGKMFNLPVVMTTSAEVGPNGRLPQEITDMYPDAPLIGRGGEVDAWDNAAFVEAVKATNRTQIIIGGIVTEVCKLGDATFRAASDSSSRLT